MAFTRFKYDESRTKKELQQSTDGGRWILNVPGNGENPCYMEDPQIIIQKWGGNLRTNAVNLESELRGINKVVTRDCINDSSSTRDYIDESKEITYPTCNNLFTEQSRATNPAWWYRDIEQVDWQFPLLNPQSNTSVPFLNNINTRILEKDYYTSRRK
jgi:hypothetical protein